MTEPMTPAENAGAAAPEDDQAIRERVREMTTQALQQGRVDPEGMREVVRAMSGGTVFDTSRQGEDARQAFAEAIKGLDQALVQSAQAAHSALEQLAARGKDYTDNDLKEALASLRKMQEDYVVTANRVAQAATGNLRRELLELALHTQRVGADAGVRMATVMNELALRMGSSYREGASSGFDAARTYGTRMALIASGVLAGVADALRDQASGKKST
jgi:phosphoribosyl-ATP pyrophosphohydrolase